MMPVRYRTADVDGSKVFYREAGPAKAPKLLLLHGFPSAGHMFREEALGPQSIVFLQCAQHVSTGHAVPGTMFIPPVLRCQSGRGLHHG